MKPTGSLMMLARALLLIQALGPYGPSPPPSRGWWALCARGCLRRISVFVVLPPKQYLWVMVVMGAILLGAIALMAILRKRLRHHAAVMREWVRREAASRKQFFDLFENSTDANYTHDLDFRVTSWNRAAELLTGYTREEMLTKKITDLLAPGSVERAAEMVTRKLQGDACSQFEIDIVAKDGRRVPLEVSSRLIDEDGSVVAVQGAARDISERKRAQEVLRRRDAILEAVSFAAQRLFQEADWKQAIESVLARLGEAAGASRAHIFENQPSEWRVVDQPRI